MSTINRPALGEDHGLGALYDARRDSFLSTKPFAEGLPEGASRVEWNEARNVKLCNNADQRAKFETLDLPSSLASSCLAGWLTLQGSAEFLRPSNPRNDDEVEIALHFSRSTITQDLCLDQEEIRDSIEDAALARESAATHVVTEILWGASCTITSTGPVLDQAERDDAAHRYQEAVRKLEKFNNVDMDLRTLLRIADDVLDRSLRLHCHSDLIPATSPTLTTLPSIKEHLEKIFDLADVGYGEAKPLAYVLTPIGSIFKHSAHAQAGLETVGQLRQTQFERVLDLFASFGNGRHLLEAYYKRLKKHQGSVRRDHRADV